ncbi:MAG: hypothetical protein Q9194_005769 [Teloschistes cf. exilis]
MDKLPTELITHIASFIESEDVQTFLRRSIHEKKVSKLPPYATISRKWQLAIESCTFRFFDLKSTDLFYFARILTGHRKRFLSHLRCEIILPTYDDKACAKVETEQDKERNSQAFTYAIHDLYQTLKESRALTLAIGTIYTPMDGYHRDDLSLREFTLNFYQSDPPNQYSSQPSALLPSEPSTDHLSRALYALSQSSTLTSLILKPIVISPELYWPANSPSTPPAWHRIQHYHVEFDLSTPDGDWYFIRDPSTPIDDDEGFADSDDGEYEEDDDTDSDPVSEDEFYNRPDIYDEYRERRAVGRYPPWRFRTVPSDIHINPLLLAMARSAAQMPDLQSMTLKTSRIGSYGTRFEIQFFAAGYASRWGEKIGETTEASLTWYVGSWRPAEEILKIWREAKEGLKIRFVEWNGSGERNATMF